MVILSGGGVWSPYLKEVVGYTHPIQGLILSCEYDHPVWRRSPCPGVWPSCLGGFMVTLSGDVEHY